MARFILGRDESSPDTTQRCPRCGMESVEGQRFCAHCGASVDSFEEVDATIRVNPRSVQDPDATMLAALPLSPQLLKKAIERSQESATQSLAGEDGAAKGEAKAFVKQARKKGYSRKHVLVVAGCAACLLLLLTLIITALLSHAGEASAQQQARQSEMQLESRLQQAREMGIPESYLEPVVKQEQQLAASEPLFAPVNPFATGYYSHAAEQYSMLQQQLPGIITTASDALQAQAQQDMQAFQIAISQGDVYSPDVRRYFSQQFSQDQLALSSAHSPRDYSTISKNAQQAIAVLQRMGIVSTRLNDLKTTLGRMGMAHLDVTGLQEQYNLDLQAFNAATSTAALQNLESQIDVQYEQAVVASIQAFPYVGLTKLNELQQQIHQLQSYGMNTTVYQQRLSADEVAEGHVKTVYDALLFIKQIDNDIASMDDDLIKGHAHALVKSFHQEVNDWAKAHPYHDSFDGRTYALDDGYMGTGIGNALDNDLAAATTSADFAAVVNEANNDLFDLHMFEADYNDHTAYNRVHETDMRMLDHYNLQGKQVLMVSLSEQVMRVYQNGKLLKAFYVTTGRAELPSPPGVWTILDRKTPATFVSGEPQNSPYWFPPTPIKYAILYHYGGDFVHDAWWRQSFGPGTQFPHADAGGNTSYNFDGSHGCINLSTNDAAWVYNNTSWNTIIVVY